MADIKKIISGLKSSFGGQYYSAMAYYIGLE